MGASVPSLTEAFTFPSIHAIGNRIAFRNSLPYIGPEHLHPDTTSRPLGINSTVLDDFSRFILAWRLFSGMAASDVAATLEDALTFAELDQATVAHRPRLLSDNGPSCVSNERAVWLEDQEMTHTRGRPYHPMAQGKTERYLRIPAKPITDSMRSRSVIPGEADHLTTSVSQGFAIVPSDRVGSSCCVFSA